MAPRIPITVARDSLKSRETAETVWPALSSDLMDRR